MKDASVPFFSLILGLILVPLPLCAQQEYFTSSNKSEGVSHFRQLIYRGCVEVNEKTRPVSFEEMKLLTSKSFNLVTQTFSRAFDENPKIRMRFEKDLADLSKNPKCLSIGNDCRSDLMALALYYYKRFRPDIPGCKEQGSTPDCQLEKEYRHLSLQNVPVSYGSSRPGIYKKNLLKIKNDLTKKLFKLFIEESPTSLHICKNIQTGLVHYYSLESDDEGDFLVGMDPDFEFDKKSIEGCKEDVTELYSEFIPGNFDEDRSTVGRDQVEPVKKKVSDFIKSNPEVVVTSVSVASTSAKNPFYISSGGKRVLDPDSDKKNLSLARERASFLEKALLELKSSSSSFKEISFEVSSELAGPDFAPLDLNERFVTKMSPGYLDRLESLFKKYEKEFKQQALKNSAMELFDENQFSNLFQAKFKPFQGFRLRVKGFKKESSKCFDYSLGEQKRKTNASKQ
jgi:hypothetical protein